MTFPFPSPMFQRTPASFSYIGQTPDTNAVATYTFTDHSIGTAHATRLVVVAIGLRGGTAVTIDSVTIGGTGASAIVTRQTGAASSWSTVALYSLAVPSGTTATIVVSLSGSSNMCQLGVYSIYNLLSHTVKTTTSSDADPSALSLNVAAGDIVLGSTAANAASSVSWTGLTENYDVNPKGTGFFTGASLRATATESPRTITADFAAGSNFAGVSAAWG